MADLSNMFTIDFCAKFEIDHVKVMAFKNHHYYATLTNHVNIQDHKITKVAAHWQELLCEQINSQAIVESLVQYSLINDLARTKLLLKIALGNELNEPYNQTTVFQINRSEEETLLTSLALVKVADFVELSSSEHPYSKVPEQQWYDQQGHFC